MARSAKKLWLPSLVVVLLASLPVTVEARPGVGPAAEPTGWAREVSAWVLGRLEELTACWEKVGPVPDPNGEPESREWQRVASDVGPVPDPNG